MDHLDPKDPPAGKATPPGPIHRTNEPHAGDHLAQYGMRPDRAVGVVEPVETEAAEVDGVKAFDDEYAVREARDHRPRSIPAGVQDAVAPHTQHPTTRK